MDRDELAKQLCRTYPKWRDKSIERVAEWIERINNGTIKPSDYVPDSDNIITFYDLIEDLRLEKFINKL